MRSTVPMRIAKIGYIVLSALTCALGVLICLTPAAAATWLGRALGIGMLIFGVIKVVGYFSRDLYRLAFQYDLAFGVLLIVLGILALTRPANAAGFLSIVLGILVLADGLFKIQIALDAKRFGIPRWWLILAVAVLSCAMGGLLAFRSAIGAQVLSVAIGLSLIMDGILNLCVSVCTVRIIRNQQPDIIDATSYEFRKD